MTLKHFHSIDGGDFDLTASTNVFLFGDQQESCQEFMTRDDDIVEHNETFTVILPPNGFNPPNVNFTITELTIQIIDNDGMCQLMHPQYK